VACCLSDAPSVCRRVNTQEFEGWLDYSQFAIRIDADHLQQLPDILKVRSVVNLNPNRPKPLIACHQDLLP
jgi:hypothetical protein